MRKQDQQLWKERDHKLVRLHLNDGEIATVEVLFVSDSEQDVIVNLISSTNVGRYEKSDVQPAFQYRFEDIAWVEPLPDRAGNA
jgi:hypothetical protein